MKCKYFDFKLTKDYGKIKEIANDFKNKKVVIFPTETVYGIGVNGLDEMAVNKLFKIKKRSFNKPINLLVSSVEMIEAVAKDLTPLDYALIEEFFPGPLTLILKKKDNIPDLLTANGDTVGVRIPANETALKLIEIANLPIATSSCNISGKDGSNNLDNILANFGEKVDYIIDEGLCDLGVASTIVKVVEGKPVILRNGTITKEQIDTVYNRVIKKQKSN